MNGTNVNQHETTVEYLIALLRQWLSGGGDVMRTDGVDPNVFLDLIRRNRLEGLVHPLLPGTEASAWKTVEDNCAAAYRKNLLHGLRQLKAGSELSARMEAAGVPCLALRGPFAGADIYGDVGLRQFTDIDLYVPRHQRRAAWNVTLAAGYRLTRDGLPRGFFERHHLHWPLVKADESTSCDLHWALDHPYKLQHVDYTALFEALEEREADGCTWRQPAPIHLLLTACMHLGKHCRDDRWQAAREGGAWAAAAHGRLSYWFEVAAVLKRYGQGLDKNRLGELAREWFVEEDCAAAFAGAANLFGCSVPWLDPPPPENRNRGGRDTTRPTSAWVGEISKLGGFQADRVDDARGYLFPPARYFREKNPAARALHRAAHTTCAAPKLLLATSEALIWPAWIKLTHRNKEAALAGKADNSS